MIQSYRNKPPRSSADFSQDSHDGDEESQGILPSSTELIYFYRETLERCALLSNKSPFLDLCSVFKKWLKVYAEDILAKSLARPFFNQTQGRRSSSDGRLGMGELYNACMVVNTADYCAETVMQVSSVASQIRLKLNTFWYSSRNDSKNGYIQTW